MHQPEPLSPGLILFARYRVEAALGEGGAAHAYRVHDLLWGDTATLKVLHNARARAAFLHEQSVLASLYSPGLPRLRDLGIDARHDSRELTYYVVDHIAGDPLHAEVVEPARVLGDVAEALHALHALGLRHGDVSPANVLVTPEGRGVLIDLGACVSLDAASDGTWSGTPGYVAPEVLEGCADGRADLYALGRTFALYPELQSLCARLSAPLSERISSARALLEALGRPAPLAPAGGARRFVGRRDVLQPLEQAIRAFFRGENVAPCVVRGAPGVGKTRLLRELRLFAQRHGSAIEMPAFERGWQGLEELVQARLRKGVEGWALACERARRAVVFVDDMPALTLESALRAVPTGSRLLLVAATSGDVSAPHVELTPLEESDLGDWDGNLSASERRALHRATAGYPREVAIALARVAAGELALDAIDRVSLPRALPREDRLRHALGSLCAGPAELPTEIALALERTGWVHVRGARAQLRRPGDAAHIAAALPALCAAAHAKAASLCEGAERVFHLYRSAQHEEADRCCEASDFEADPAGWHRATNGVAPPRIQARALRVAGRNAEALALLGTLDDSAGVERERTLALLGLGRADEALAHASRAKDAALLSRVRLRTGDFEGALEALQDEAPGRRSDVEESRGAALAYLDRRTDAEAALELAARLDAGTPRAQVRRAIYRGIAASRAGDVRAAVQAYGEARSRADAHRLVDLLATALMNEATALQQIGEWGRALEGYERAERLARVLGRANTVRNLRFNLANLFIACGDADRAEAWLDEGGSGALGAAVRIARGELLSLRADPRSREAFEAAVAFARAEGVRREELEARQLLREPCLDEAKDLGAKDVLARAWALRGEASSARDAQSCFVKALTCAEDAGDLGLLADIYARAANAMERAGAQALARRYEDEAQRRFEQILLSLPAGASEGFWRRWGRPKTPVAADDRFRRILEINKRLNSTLPKHRLLEHALDAAIELAQAERGFVLVAGAEIGVAVARNLDRDRLEEPEMRFSRSIAERVLESQAPVVTTNAQADPRFRAQRSVHAMGLQSVACVPITSPRGVLGALYVDHRFAPRHFDGDALEVLVALSDQVALALDAAALRSELEAKARRLEVESAERAALLREREAALAASQSELARLKEAPSKHRYDYAPLVGQSEGMRAVFAVLDRLVESDLSVLIQGESGTGKELIARALHRLGPRQGPFLALNCAALPETLLESQLFGHRRGAFTGADTDHEGLFVAASGGTLFLDEVGEMAPTVQAKVLRALQEREVRPLGSDRAVPFDARVLSATNRDLREESEEGRFREDLYYRLAVVTVQVPALRERLDDLPLLVEGVLAELHSSPVRIEAAAMRALLAHSWPGNVRELRNVLGRALALGSGASIGLGDLALVRPKARTRRDHEADQATAIARALDASDWNVSEAARRLSMPRNTLYRRMKKYGLQR